ncbi:uncharacterized protein CLUP02_16072 [Colletotrichum lupini]|uniref:Secreted protein n=1 Tax=Colletotrichum lupini TaxID=145971 RepID=A0A9Q8T983_9PEZI|nr:uncharacterized protein CLUP02_16072 [Colletotrichum lupini]UQC90542.1 hypothetical protein CLUP02_16072 [Colletotrichum lupini]
MQKRDANPPKSRFASFPLLLFLTPPVPPWPWRQPECSCLLYPYGVLASPTCLPTEGKLRQRYPRCASFLPCG